MADTVRVGLDRFVLDALRGEALEQRVEPGDGQGDPARARLRGVRLDEERRVLVDVPENLVPGAMSGGRPKNRVYQSMLASRSETGTPAKRPVIALISATVTVRRADADLISGVFGNGHGVHISHDAWHATHDDLSPG